MLIERKMVIGLVGPIASGKGEIANFLRQKGFSYFSLSERVREETSKRGLILEREMLQNVGDSLRKEFGNDVLAKRTLELIEEAPNSNIVIDGIRNPAEIVFLKENLNIFLVGVTAPREIRLKFYLERNRDSDPKKAEDFYKVDERDSGRNQESYGQQVGICLKKSDFIIENTGTLKDLKIKIEKLLEKLLEE